MCVGAATAHAGDAVDKAGSIKLGPDTFKVPVAPDYHGRRSAPSNDKSAAVSLPDRIDLGGSVLRFDTSRSALTPAPKAGIYEDDQSTFNPGVRTRKESPLQPNYFGLTLTTPTH